MRNIELRPAAIDTFEELVTHHAAEDDDGGAEVFQTWIDEHEEEPGWGLAALMEVAVSEVVMLREQLKNRRA